MNTLNHNVARRLANLLLAIKNCEQSGNETWQIRHGDTINAIVKEHMPSGGGFDAGTTLDESSTGERLIFNTSFHHMDEHGGYDGWTEHRVTVKASLAFGLSIIIGGRDRNGIKDFIYQAFDSALTTESRF